MPHQRSVLAVVTAIDDGGLLAPLTAQRTTAAVPFGGIYRLVDFALTNCLHSGFRRVLVLTQYNSHSLTKHLRDGWSIFNPELQEYVTAVAPQFRAGQVGYAGPRDALLQNLHLLERNPAEHVVVLSGCHVYRMDYAAMVAAHQASGAAVTVAVRPAGQGEGLGGLALLDLGPDDAVRGARPIGPGERPEAEAMVSMGVTVIDKGALLGILEAMAPLPAADDLAAELLPGLPSRWPAQAYRFGGTTGRVTPDRYWRRLGSLDEYYQTNMDLLRAEAPLDLYQADWPLRTYQTQNPPARTVPGRSSNEGVFVNSIVAGGTVIAGGGVNHSVLFSGVRVEDSATVEASLLLAGAVVGEGARLDRCIIEKGVVVPPGTRIGYDRAADAARFHVTPGGVVVVVRGARFD